MYAATISAPGGPEVLDWGEVPDPVVGPGDVLIDVAAAGLNRADLLQRLGRYDPPPGASAILGLECSGIVVGVGDDLGGSAGGNVTGGGFAVGDEVCALLAGGGYAERVAVPATQVLPVPQGVSLVDAAALPEATCTVWSNLVMTAGLREGQFVLAHGGSSGIGTMAVQIAHALGARVGVTASSAEKLAIAEKLGAEVLIDYRTEDFVARTLDATQGCGADVILDVVGAEYLNRNVRALADGGRLVIIGTMSGARAELDIAALMNRRAGVIGTKLRNRPETGHGSKAQVVAEVREHVWPLIAAGSIRPVIGARVALDHAGEAHRMLQEGETVGKIVLVRRR